MMIDDAQNHCMLQYHPNLLQAPMMRPKMLLHTPQMPQTAAACAYDSQNAACTYCFSKTLLHTPMMPRNVAHTHL